VCDETGAALTNARKGETVFQPLPECICHEQYHGEVLASVR